MKVLSNNLINKTQDDLKTQREIRRDDYSFAIVFLPLIGVVIWLGLVLINFLVIDKSRRDWEEAVIDKKRTITETYQQTLVVHGELVIKTNQLAGVIDKDIQPEEIFILVEKLFPEDPEFTVTGFGRNSDGSFRVTVTAPNFIKFAKIARRFSLYEKVTDLQVESVALDTLTNQIVGTVNFNFAPPGN